MSEFIRYNYSIGDTVVINENPCGNHCGCTFKRTVERSNKDLSFLEEGKEYIIEDISYFGGGCPSILLHLKDVKETANVGLFAGVSANWFKPINN